MFMLYNMLFYVMLYNMLFYVMLYKIILYNITKTKHNMLYNVTCYVTNITYMV